MIGIIVQLAISWLLIWYFEKGNLNVLGFIPTKNRITSFLLFFFVSAVCCTSGYLLRMFFASEEWTLNPSVSFGLIAEGTWWNVKSVLFEELIFRGVLLYILIKKLGAIPAVIISSVCFGIYHWFSYEILGQPLQMLIIFITTGLMGAIYAYGYAKTFSLYIPCAIHLGWNITSSVVFSDTVIGKQLLVQAGSAPEVTVSYFIYFLVFFFPIISALLISFILIKKKKQALPPVVHKPA